MANVYVYSGAAGAGTGADWANAYTDLQTAAAAKLAGDDFYVAHDHAQTQAGNLAIVFPGTVVNPNRVFCVNRAGTVPPVSADLRTTATITTTTTGTLAISGCAYIYGIIFSIGSGAAGVDCNLGLSSNSDLYFDACSLRQGGTTGGRMLISNTTNSTGARVTWNNTTYQVASVNATIQVVKGQFLWKNTAAPILGATIPTNLFGTSAAGGGTTLLDGIDLNAMSTKTGIAALTSDGIYYIKDCKLPVTWTLCAAPTSPAPAIYLIRSASGATAYTLEKHDCRGDQTTEIAIVRSGGAAINGTPISRKVITSANAKPQNPFVMTPFPVTNDTVSANVTVTVYGIWGGGAVPNNDDIWMEVGYLGSAATPQLSFLSTGKADLLAAGAAVGTDASSWGGSTTPFKLVAVLSAPQPQLAGEIYVTVKCGKTSSTFYLDPKAVLT